VFSVLYTCLRPAMGPIQRDRCFPLTTVFFCKPARTPGSHFSMLPSIVNFLYNSVGHETVENEKGCRSTAGLCLQWHVMRRPLPLPFTATYGVKFYIALA